MSMIKRLCYNKDMAKKSRGGFTLIELSISLVFIAILSLTVVLLIQNLAASYRRGLVLNQVNTVGMDLIDDFRSSIQNATSDPVSRMCEVYYPNPESTDRQACMSDNASSFVSVTRMANVKVEGNNLGELPVYGAFCTGTYTYIWNSGYFRRENDVADFDGNIGESTVGDDGISPAEVGTKNFLTQRFRRIKGDFRLLKIYDDERSICVNTMKVLNNTGNISPYHIYDIDDMRNKVPNQFAINSGMVSDNANDVVELLKTDKAADLVLYDLYVAKPAISGTRQNLFYSASFILGTRRGGLNIKQIGDSCKPPNDDFSELEYCAINKFNFAVMAGGF